MKPKDLYNNLLDAAEKLGISVTEKSFKNYGMKVESGLCKIRGETVYIMDKHLPLSIKMRLLAGCLKNEHLEDVYIAPAVREYLERMNE